MDYDVTFIGDICHGEIATSVKVVVPVTSLCPARRRFLSVPIKPALARHGHRPHQRFHVGLKRSSNSSNRKPPANCTACSNARMKNT